MTLVIGIAAGFAYAAAMALALSCYHQRLDRRARIGAQLARHCH